MPGVGVDCNQRFGCSCDGKVSACLGRTASTRTTPNTVGASSLSWRRVMATPYYAPGNCSPGTMPCALWKFILATVTCSALASPESNERPLSANNRRCAPLAPAKLSEGRVLARSGRGSTPIRLGPTTPAVYAQRGIFAACVHGEGWLIRAVIFMASATSRIFRASSSERN